MLKALSMIGTSTLFQFSMPKKLRPCDAMVLGSHALCCGNCVTLCHMCINLTHQKLGHLYLSDV